MRDKHEPRLTGYKVCSRCGVEQPVINFGVDKRANDGLRKWCRSCIRIYEKPYARKRTMKTRKVHHYREIGE